jgi:hypothetical protein
VRFCDFFDRLASGFPAAAVFFYWVDEGAAIQNTLLARRVEPPHAQERTASAAIDPLSAVGFRGPLKPRKERETIMKTTNTIQHALFRTVDSLDRQTLRDGHAVRELLIQAALQLTPFLHAALAQHIEMLVTEYCPT